LDSSCTTLCLTVCFLFCTTLSSCCLYVLFLDCEKPLAKLPLSCQTLKDLILCDDMSSSLRLLTRCDPNPPPLRPQNYTQLRTVTNFEYVCSYTPCLI
jgi:hypothetical protein